MNVNVVGHSCGVLSKGQRTDPVPVGAAIILYC